MIFFMDVGGLYVYLDRRRLNVISDLEKDFFLGLMSYRERKSAAVFILPGTWAILK